MAPTRATRLATAAALSLLVGTGAALDVAPGSAGPRRLGLPSQLHLRPDGTFKMALFCDMHFGESADKDVQSVQFERTILKLEQPDVVVIDGDASSNYAAPKCPDDYTICKDYFRNNWQNFTRPLEEAGVPYAYTLGNHDRIPSDTAGTPYEVPDHWIMELDVNNKHSVSQDGPSAIHGASNYVVPVLDAAGKPALYIWLLDSSDNNCMGVTGWGCVYPDQVEWYKNVSAQLKQRDGRTVPGVMFHHIPTPEVMEAWSTPGVEVWGSKEEDVCCFSKNTGLFAAIKEVGNVFAAFHGHDHNNDFVANYQGVHIGYGRKSGYGGYGGSVADKHGSRILNFANGAGDSYTWVTWIREETGAQVVQTATTDRAQQGKCCGEAAEEGRAMAPAELCRKQDDAAMCRLASGMPPLAPELAALSV